MLRIVQLAQEQVPQASRLGFAFQLFHDRRDDLPPLDGIVRDLRMVEVFGRKTLGLKKVDEVLESLFGKAGEPGLDLQERGRVQKGRSDHVRERSGKNVGTHQGPSRFADIGSDRVRGSVGRHIMVALYVRGSNR